VLCDDKVRYLGDAVALVAADTPAIAAQALKLIQVEYEVLPVVSDAEQARQADAPLVHEDWKSGNLLRHIEVRHGDVEQGLAEADVVVEREYRTPMIEHMFLEPECSIGVPSGYDVREPTRLSSSQAQSNDAQHPKLTVYAGSQIPYDDRAQIAAAMNLPPEKVRVIGAFIGGAFGGKEDIAGQIHAALLAQATGRPVKILYDRAESMLVHPKRHATIIRIKTGAKKDGTLTAIQAELIGDAGAYASLSPKVLARTTTHATGPYQVPHVSIDCYAMYTNNPPAGAFRGFGVPQSAFAAESNMDILAHELGLDPFALRRKNALRVGSTTVTGQTLKDSVGLLACLDWVESRVKAHQYPIPSIQYPIPNPTPTCTTRRRKWLRSGDYSPLSAWGIAAAYKNTGLGGGADDAAGAEVEIYPDGTAEVRAGAADLGQGLSAVVAQCVAEELGLAYERVHVLLSDTDLAPDGGPTTASRQTYITGNAARLAARGMRDRLASVVSERWDVAPDTISFQDGVLRAGGHEAPMSKVVEWLQEEGQETRLTYHYHAPATRPLGQGGDMHFAFSYSVQAALVEVDTSSGQVRVLRIVAACDAGRAINPQALLGQIEGGLMMGLGNTLTEEYKVEDGIPQTLRWADYAIPLIGHTPDMDLHIVEDATLAGPYGAKGIGELPSIPTAPAICNAIYRAVGVRVQRLPVRAGDILAPAGRDDQAPGHFRAGAS